MTHRLPRRCDAGADQPKRLLALVRSADSGRNYTDTRSQPADEATPPAPPTAVSDPAPAPTADANSTAAAHPEESASTSAPEEQLMDDASATNMTKHSLRGEATPGATLLAEPGEQK